MSKSIGGKPWYKINTGYYQNINGQQVAVKPGATYKGYAAVPNNGLCWQACPVHLLNGPGLIKSLTLMVRNELCLMCMLEVRWPNANWCRAGSLSPKKQAVTT